MNETFKHYYSVSKIYNYMFHLPIGLIKLLEYSDILAILLEMRRKTNHKAT